MRFYRHPDPSALLLYRFTVLFDLLIISAEHQLFGYVLCDMCVSERIDNRILKKFTNS